LHYRPLWSGVSSRWRKKKMTLSEYGDPESVHKLRENFASGEWGRWREAKRAVERARTHWNN